MIAPISTAAGTPAAAHVPQFSTMTQRAPPARICVSERALGPNSDTADPGVSTNRGVTRRGRAGCSISSTNCTREGTIPAVANCSGTYTIVFSAAALLGPDARSPVHPVCELLNHALATLPCEPSAASARDSNEARREPGAGGVGADSGSSAKLALHALGSDANATAHRVCTPASHTCGDAQLAKAA